MNHDRLSVHDGNAPAPPPVHDRTLPRMLLRQCEQRPDAPLLTMSGVLWTHGEAARAAASRGASLRAAGIGRSDRVALMCTNRIQALEVFLGCGWIGAISVPINTASKGPQIQYYLDNCQARLLVIDARFVDQLTQLDFSKTAVQAIWVVPDSKAAPAVTRTIGSVGLQDYPEGGRGIPPEDVLPSDALSILYTSGTTGPAKGVVSTHGHYYLFGLYSAQMLGVVESDVLSTTLPLFHINALNTFAQACIVGCQVVIHESFSASNFWTMTRACKATVIYLLGAMVPILLAQPRGDDERAHRVRVGLGGAVPAPLADAFDERTGVTLVDGYASTEATVVISNPPGRRGLGALGWLRPGFQARVADELDVAVAPGEAGELLLRADEPFAFSAGYFGLPDKTAEAWRNLWFHTGDRVMREADGSFRFLDRMKDAIRRRGENISSYEVEQALLSHPCVAQVAAFPVRSELAEDEVMVALVAHPGHQFDLADVAAHCERVLPYFAVPRYFDVVVDLPRTENGKVRKFKLRDAGITATTWERPGAALGRKGTSP